ncbi:MAG TPA: DUF4384 domain-containing protein [Bryobacteraceae bacterium]|nr:DUF4384 domain-containing protein [Bryobacteraceae bacterium]
MRHSVVLSLAFAVFTAAAQEAPKPQFTARELFYSAAPEPAQPAKPPAKPATSAPRPAVAAKKPAVQPKPAETAAVSTPATPSQPAAVTHSSESVTRPDGTMVVKTALVTTAPAPENGTPLGLKYTILKNSGDSMVEVPPDTVFHAYDKIQVKVQTNSPGYLYVVLKGTSGTWTPMFPSPEVADGDNHVDGWSARVVPPGTRMVFDTQTGTEHLFIVFSRTPEKGLEDMIYSLQGGAKAQPAADKSMDKPKKKYVMTASAEIPDSAIGQLRDTYTRDLIIETVDDKTPEDKSSTDKKEDAVYVVNPSGSADSRVVAEIQLVHQ